MSIRSGSSRRTMFVPVTLLLVAVLGVWIWPAGASTTGDVMVVSINYQPHVKLGVCTVYANVWGGTGPYTYEWTGLFEGDGLYEQAYLTGSGYVYLKVTDDDDNEGFDEAYIQVDVNGHDCGI